MTTADKPKLSQFDEDDRRMLLAAIKGTFRSALICDGVCGLILIGIAAFPSVFKKDPGTRVVYLRDIELDIDACTRKAA